MLQKASDLPSPGELLHACCPRASVSLLRILEPIGQTVLRTPCQASDAALGTCLSIVPPPKSWAAGLQVNVNKVWLTVSSVLLGFSFVFGTSIRTTFESVVFLFVVHPYDVGDMLLLTDPNDLPSGGQYCQVRGRRETPAGSHHAASAPECPSRVQAFAPMCCSCSAC